MEVGGARAFVRSHSWAFSSVPPACFAPPSEKLPSFLGSSDYHPGDRLCDLVLWVPRGFVSPPAVGVALAFPRVLSDGSPRLFTCRSSEPCCDPHLGL